MARRDEDTETCKLTDSQQAEESSACCTGGASRGEMTERRAQRRGNPLWECESLGGSTESGEYHAITAPAENLHGWGQERDAEIETVTVQTTFTATPMRENVDS